jgi:uncharacterized protein YkwD
MTPKTFLRTLVIVAATFLYSPARVMAQAGGTNYKDLETEILKLVNDHRTGMHLKPLKMNGIITAAAERHSKDMATGKVPFGHDGFNERMEQLSKQLKPAYSFAENVGQGMLDAKGVVDMWLNSPGHKKNIEDDYNITGIGICKGKDGDLYFTQIFLLHDYGK